MNTTIPNIELIDTLYLGTLDPQGLWISQEPPHGIGFKEKSPYLLAVQGTKAECYLGTLHRTLASESRTGERFAVQ